MNAKFFARVTLAATAAQVGMVVAGHYSAPIRDNLFALGGMAISLLAGVFYARISRGGWIASLVGGLLSGGACAFLGIGVSVFLGIGLLGVAAVVLLWRAFCEFYVTIFKISEDLHVLRQDVERERAGK